MAEHEHAGHRDRLRGKVESGTLLPHEQLEILLYPLLPRRNTNDIAHRLLKRFGSIYALFQASVAELMQVKGIGERAAQQLYNLGRIYLLHIEPEKGKRGFEGTFNSLDFLPFVKERYVDEECEVVDLYLLDSCCEIVKCYRFTDERENSVELDSGELSKILSQETPSGIVLVHNHPSGLATSSFADLETTKRCQLVCNMHGVLLCDHIIYAKDGVYSYYLSGKLQAISHDYSVNAITLEEGEVDLGK